MVNYFFSSPFFFLIWAGALLTAITVHEFAHALAADRLGDPTPRLQGRLTLNPLAHLDPIGTLMLLLIRFGWGKPVEFDPYNLKNPRRDAAIISLAGPASNIVFSALLSILYRLTLSPIIPPFIILNVSLAVFNMVPVHPLDGGKILVGLLDQPAAYKTDLFLRQYGTFLLLLMILPLWGGASPILAIISPIINIFLSIFLPGYSQVV